MASSASDPLPRIGLTTYVEDARWGVWDRPAAVLPHSYVAAVLAAGGLPILLPASPTAAARRAVEGLDALILTGGADVAEQPERDRWEMALLQDALDVDLPLLAICRGVQVLNVALGGTLHPHLPDVVGHDGHRPSPAVLGTTDVMFAPDSAVAAILGPEAKVPCYHHQALKRIGAGIEVVGRAGDDTVEAVEVPGPRFVIGVQWHPEDGDDPRLFDALVAAVR